jgi:hypothetical protein
MAEHAGRLQARHRGVLLVVLLLTLAATQTTVATSGPTTLRAEAQPPRAAGLPSAAAARSRYDKAVLADRPVGFWHNAQGADLVSRRNAVRVGEPGSTVLPNGDTAANFDGSRSYLEVADNDRWSPATTGTLTIEAWIRPSTLRFTSGRSAVCYVHWLGKGVTGQYEWTLRMYSDLTPCESPSRPNRVSVYAFNLPGGLGTGAYFQGGLDGVPVIHRGEWVHVVGVINGNKKSRTFPHGYVRIYRNGDLINTRDLFSTVPVTLRNGSAPLRIGTRDLASFFQGSIGKVALYDYEVAGARLLAHYNSM